jgi:FkbM family methyltransferase
VNRSLSYLAQGSFDLTNKLHRLSVDSNLLIRLLARSLNKLLRPVARKLGNNHIVFGYLYGHRLAMPAEHPLAGTVAAFPQYNRPLALAVEAILKARTESSPLVVIDVGANIGETVAIIEQHRPGFCTYLCIEPDREIAELCRLNHSSNSRVQIMQSFIGEQEGVSVRLQDDGRANPSTLVSAESQFDEACTSGRLVRLDTIAASFVESHQCFSLLKVDTEGYDFSVLRSGHQLVKKYKPAIYFEWFPKLLLGLNEGVCDGFEYLRDLGYRYFVFFTGQGDFYCEVADPDRLCLQSLASVALRNETTLYFDVFASTSETLCNLLVEISTTKDSSELLRASTV